MPIPLAVLLATLAALFLCAHAAEELVPESIDQDGMCEKNFQCHRGFTCAPRGGPKDTVCLPMRTINDPCNDLEDCASEQDLRCIGGVCSKPGKQGTSCSQYLDDGDCVSPFTCINKTCSPPSDVGGPCDVFWNCKAPLTCIKNTCRPKSKHGGDCDSSIDCEDAVCTRNSRNELKCDADIGSIFGSLVAFTFVIVTTGTLQFCAWRPRRR